MLGRMPQFDAATQPERVPWVHLYRGAPAVRHWSTHQATIEDWTLCGIRRELRRLDRVPTIATGEASQVTCEYCLDLMGPKSWERAKEAREPLRGTG
jgi:hypothetical protein